MGSKSQWGFLLALLSIFANASAVNDSLSFFETGEVGKFTGTRKVTIQYRIFETHKANQAIVILPGYAENAQKYHELIYDFVNYGFSVYILDHRGMGASGRELKNRQVVHVESFDDYVTDLETFYRQVVEKGKESHRYLFTHSAGGLIGAKFLAKFKGAFRRAVLSAPLFSLNTGSYPKFVAGGLAFTLDTIGRGENYAPGFSDYDPTAAKWGEDSFTSSKQRFDAYTTILLKHPRLVMGGPSVHWIREVLRETASSKVGSLGKRVSIPLLVYQAGADTLVLPTGQNAFCKAAKNCQIVYYPRARHEIYREIDQIRNEAIRRAVKFFEE
jgi:lysophospholipase